MGRVMEGTPCPSCRHQPKFVPTEGPGVGNPILVDLMPRCAKLSSPMWNGSNNVAARRDSVASILPSFDSIIL